MNRNVSIVAAILVSVGVFTWLAGPLLETQFGTEALLVSYGAVALAAGGLTYLVLSGRVLRSTRDASLADGETVEATLMLEEVDVETEMEQLKHDEEA